MPGEALDEPATEDRTCDRAEQHRDPEDGHHAADPVRTGGARHDRHAQRHQHAAAEALDDTERDQLGDAPGQAAQDGAGGEERQCGHVEALGAEAVGSPPCQRDDRREGERVGRHRPRHLGVRGVELVLEGRQRDAHDGDVEDGHDRAEHDDTGDLQDGGVELVTAGRRAGGTRSAGRRLGVLAHEERSLPGGVGGRSASAARSARSRRLRVGTDRSRTISWRAARLVRSWRPTRSRPSSVSATRRARRSFTHSRRETMPRPTSWSTARPAAATETLSARATSLIWVSPERLATARSVRDCVAERSAARKASIPSSSQHAATWRKNSSRWPARVSGVVTQKC